MKRVLLSITFLLIIRVVGYSQTHFTPVWTGNGLDHMNIYVTSATIDGIPLQPFDEIGVFDDGYCVGVVQRGELLTPYLEIRVSKDDPLTPEVDGFQVDSIQYFKIYDFSEDATYEFPVVQVTSGDPTFQIGGTAMVILSVKTNKPPIASAGSSVVVDEGKPVKFIGTGSSDPDNNTLSYTWKVEPVINGLDLTNDTLAFNAPEVDANKLYIVKLVVNDGFIDSDTNYVSLYVRNVNKKPVVTSQSTVTVNEDTPLTINIGMVTIDDPDPAQTHTLKVLPGNYLINNNTITPLPDFNGTLAVPIIISDGLVNSDIYELVVTVSPVNDLPKFTSSPSLSILQGNIYVYSLTADDIDGDVLTYAATVKPTWLTLSNDGNNKGTLSGTPTITEVGNHNITITLSDGTANVTQSFVLTVKPITNAPELVTTELAVAYAGSAYSSTLSYYDFDSDSIFVSLQNQPSWLTLQGNVNGIAKLKTSNKTVSVNLIGTPTNTSLGTFGINILYNDKVNKRSKILPLKVLTANTKPTALDFTLTTNEDEPVLIALKGTDNETPYGLKYAIYNQLKHGQVLMVSPRLFIYYPEANYFGKDSLEYSVVEQGISGLGDSAKLVININPVNDAPVITADQTKFELNEGSTATVTGIDYNDNIDLALADVLSLTSIFGPFNGTFDKVTGIYSPDQGFYGQDVIFLAAVENSNGGLTSDPLMLRFNVQRVNKPPYASVNAVKLEEDIPVSFIPLVFDREDDINDLLIELTSNPNHGTIKKEGIVLTFTPTANWSGTDSISFKVMDSQGVFSPELTVYLFCDPINDFPVALPLSIDAASASTVSLDFTSLVSDVDNTLGQLSIEFLLTNARDSSSGIFTSEINKGSTPMTFTYNSQHTNGFDYIPYRVFDGKNTSAPSLISITNLATTKDFGAKIIDTLISKGDYIDITWGDTVDLIFTSMASTTTMTIAPDLVITNLTELKGKLSTPKVLFFEPGNPLITYKARYIAPSKSGKKARGNDTAVLFDKVGFKTRKGAKAGEVESNVDTVYLGNLKTGVPVAFYHIQNQIINENQTATVDIRFTDPDTPHEKIVFDADTSVAGTVYNFNLLSEGNQVLTVTPPAEFFGELVMNIKATDTTAIVTETQFIITVNQVNQAPRIISVDSIYYMKNNQRVISTIISDRETTKDNLTTTINATPAEAVSELLEKDGDITVVPANDYAQDFLVNLNVSDGTLSTSKTIKMKYKSSNSMPTLDPINSELVLEDELVSIDVTPFDADLTDPLEVTVESSNAALIDANEVTISPVSSTSGTLRTMTFTPKNNQSGISEITVYADDGFKKAAQQFSIEVKPKNDDPALSSIENQTMKNDETLTLTLLATDVDSYVFDFGASSTNSNLDIQVTDNIVTIKVLNSYVGDTQFTVTVADDSSATNSQEVLLTVQPGTGISSPDLKELYVYPNPISSELYINWTNSYSGTSKLFVYNTQGQLVESRSVDLVENTPTRVDLSKLTSGLYVIKLQTDKELYYTRVVKK